MKKILYTSNGQQFKDDDMVSFVKRIQFEPDMDVRIYGTIEEIIDYGRGKVLANIFCNCVVQGAVYYGSYTVSLRKLQLETQESFGAIAKAVTSEIIARSEAVLKTGAK